LETAGTTKSQAFLMASAAEMSTSSKLTNKEGSTM
jgi:hypothetical protein